jgi:hypothetical protein
MNSKLKGILDAYPHFPMRSSLILMGYRGSIAHGTHVPKSDPDSIDDKDVMGISVPENDYYLGLKKFEHWEKQEEEWDIVIYELKKMIRLLLKSNPNVLCLLWLEPNHYIIRTELGELLIQHRGIFSSREIYKSFLGYAHGQLKRMEKFSFEGYMGRKRKELVERFGYDCYHPDTEFLTDEGWKRFEEVDMGNSLATINKETLSLEFQRPSKAIKRFHNGDLYWFNGRYTSMLVTPNHNMFVSKCHRSKSNNFSVVYDDNVSNWNLESASSLMLGHYSCYHVLTAPMNNLNEDLKGITNQYLQLLGLSVSEGCFAKFGKDGKPRCIRVNQTNHGKNEVYQIMDSLPRSWGFRKYEYEREGKPGMNDTVWISYHYQTVNRLWNDTQCNSSFKRLPLWISQLSMGQAEILIHSMMLGDGTRKKKAWVYYTYRKGLADDLQTLALIACKNNQIMGPYGSCYHVYIQDGYSSPSVLYFNPKIKRSTKVLSKGGILRKYCGDVICFTVPNGTLITRFNGKVAIQGNCKNASHLIRILRLGIEFLATGELNVMRHDNKELIAIKRGEWTLEQVKNESRRLFATAEETLVHSPLPIKPDHEAANHLCSEILHCAIAT